MNPQDRDGRILSLKPVVLAFARRRKIDLPSFVIFDDLVQAGWVGAIEAVDRYDPARNVPLAAFAKWRISGAIDDYLRTVDPLGRDHRAKIKRGEAPEVATISLDGHPNEEMLGKSLHSRIADPRVERDRRRRNAAIDIGKISGRVLAKRDPRRPNSENETRRNLRILARHSLEGEKMKRIGKAFGVNESRISQICSETMQKLRAAA